LSETEHREVLAEDESGAKRVSTSTGVEGGVLTRGIEAVGRSVGGLHKGDRWWVGVTLI